MFVQGSEPCRCLSTGECTFDCVETLLCFLRVYIDRAGKSGKNFVLFLPPTLVETQDRPVNFVWFGVLAKVETRIRQQAYFSRVLIFFREGIRVRKEN